MSKHGFVVSLAIGALLAMAMPVLATTVDTVPNWDGTNSITWGQYGTGVFGQLATVGQTFTMPAAENTLDSFTFRLLNTSPTLQFSAYIMAWDSGAGHATGPVLFSQGFSGLPASGPLTFNPNLVLTPGQQYVAFLSTSQTGYSGPDKSSLGNGTGNFYSGGQYVMLDNGGNPNLWTSTSWGSSAGYDTAFAMTFSNSAISVVPEPMTCLGVVGGLASLGAYLRRRKAALAA